MLTTDADRQIQTNNLIHMQMRDLDGAEPVLEVIVLWGEESVLHVAHLNPPRAFYVGDTQADAESPIDLVLGAESIGSVRLPIALQEGGDTFAVVPAGATGYVECGGALLSFAELAARGLMQPCAELPGANQVRLAHDTSARIEHRGFCFLVRRTLAARRIGVARGLPIDWQASRFTLGSVALHVALLGLFYFAPPNSTVLAIDRLGADSRLVDYLVTLDETVLPEPSWDATSDAPHAEGGDKGAADKGDSGRAGTHEAPKTQHRLAVAGPADNDDPTLAREIARDLILSESIIGILKSNVGDVNAPTSPFGRIQAEKADPISAIGAVIGDTLGQNYGIGGIGMIGSGRHGGGYAVNGTVGSGPFGTFGIGGGRKGYGSGVAGLGGRKSILPTVRALKTDISGALSKEVIRRTVAQHLNEVRFCYQQALQTRPELQGRVAVKFVIGATGAVTVAAGAGSDLDDPTVQKCVVDAVKRWTFPAPEGGGLVIVTYPFMLQQAGG